MPIKFQFLYTFAFNTGPNAAKVKILCQEPGFKNIILLERAWLKNGGLKKPGSEKPDAHPCSRPSKA